MSGIRNIWRLAVLVVLCAVVAPVTAASTQASTSAISVNVSKGLNYATFTISPTIGRMTVSVGTDPQSMESKAAPSGAIRIEPLAPNTRYFYVVNMTSKSGKTTRIPGTFTTDSWDSSRLSASTESLHLNGEKTFSIMVKAFDECPTDQVVAKNRVIGGQYFYHNTWYGCGEGGTMRWLSAEDLSARLKGRMGWIQDGPRTGYYPPGSPPIPSWDSLDELIDVQGKISFDKFAVELISCGGNWDSAEPLYRRLKQKAQRRPVISEIRLLRTIGTNATCTSGQRMTALFWTPVLAGADGIIYVTQQDRDEGVEVDGRVMNAAGLQAKRLAGLYPVVFGGQSEAASSSNDIVKVLARKWGDSTYIFALNLGGREETSTLKVGRSTLSAKVFWESRSVSVKNGSVSDNFKPYELQVYQLKTS